jgi:DNA-binding Xre family transcriptional regulator
MVADERYFVRKLRSSLSFLRGGPTRKCRPPPLAAARVHMAPILGVQSFLARAALGWNLRDLSNASGISPQAVAHFERGGRVKASTLEAIQRALEKAGVIFIDANDVL